MGKIVTIFVIILLVLIYRNAFVSPFFQDDKLFLETAIPQNFLTPIPSGHYHPIPNQLFYFFSQSLFGQNVLGFHLLEFGVFLATVFLIFSIAQKILKSKSQAFFTMFFYAFNVSLFAQFYWVAVSYFVFGSFFFFLTIYFFLKRGKLNALFTLISFVLAVGSNEINIVTVLVFPALALYLGNIPKRLFILLGLDMMFLGLKNFWVGFSSESVYKLQFNFRALATFRWYVFRALNLPEGVNRNDNFLMYSSFIGTLIVYLISLIESRPNLKLIILGIFWFVICAFPFYFLPEHMSAYYLSTALFGPAFVVGRIILNKKIGVLFCIFYLILTISGLEFLSRTHWIILKP